MTAILSLLWAHKRLAGLVLLAVLLLIAGGYAWLTIASLRADVAAAKAATAQVQAALTMMTANRDALVASIQQANEATEAARSAAMASQARLPMPTWQRPAPPNGRRSRLLSAPGPAL